MFFRLKGGFLSYHFPASACDRPISVRRKEGIRRMFKLSSYRIVFPSSLFSSPFSPDKECCFNKRSARNVTLSTSVEFYWSQRNDFQATYVFMARLFIRSVLQNNMLSQSAAIPIRRIVRNSLYFCSLLFQNWPHGLWPSCFMQA